MEIGTQSPKPEGKVANLNTSSSGLLGMLDDSSDHIPVKSAAARD